MIETMILRFRDLSTELGETIKQHKLLSDAEGYVRWGWWKKYGETVPATAFQTIAQKAKAAGGLKVFLFDSGTFHLHEATLTDISWHHMFDYIHHPIDA
ncbi:MAG: metallophosphoesterase [Geminicoccaceae bacterium]|nr:metallophosphoesterase [Geminicoccaceae bacterium]